MKRPVVIIDFGGQNSNIIARHIRELGFWSIILPGNTTVSELDSHNPHALILYGATENGDNVAQGLLDLGLPVLTIGSSLLVDAAGGRVDMAEKHKKQHPQTDVQQWQQQLVSFLQNICELEPNWSMEQYIEDTLAAVAQQVGSDKVICGLSGGVDSAVAAALVHKAVGDQLTCFFVDHGLLRKDEVKDVMETFAHRGIKIVQLDAQQRFLERLQGVTDPEQKRKIIGDQFIREFETAARELGDARFLVQGTVYPDVIESGSGGGETIKSHHNVGGLPEDMQFELCEPVRELFKDEVRKVGSLLGLPDSIVWRQPFPGPGLGIRVLGEVTSERLAIVREADAILRQEIAAAGLDREVWQYFAALPGVHSVGVQDGRRTYQELVAIRAVTSIDGMSADWVRLPWQVLEQISQRILTEVDHVNRVVYDITGKPPGTIEWE